MNRIDCYAESLRPAHWAAFLGAAVVLAPLGAQADDRDCIRAPSVACITEIAVERARELPESRNWAEIAKNLALAGQFEDATILGGRLADAAERAHFEETLAIAEVAIPAKARPHISASLEPIVRLGSWDRISSAYHLLALELLGEDPFVRGGTPWVVAAEEANARAAIRQQNATLRAILRDWPRIIEHTSGWRRVRDRIDLADALEKSSDVEGARRVLSLIDPGRLTQIDRWSLTQAWLWVGDIDTARLVALTEPESRQRGKLLIQVATDFVERNRLRDALNVVELVFSVSEKQKDVLLDVKSPVALIRIQFAAGDREGSTQRADQLAALAKRADPFRPFNMTAVAALLNELGQTDQAYALLTLALDYMPDDTDVVAFGFHAGLISYGRWGLDDNAIEAIAVEFYRSGDQRRAIELIRKLPRLNKWRASLAMVRFELSTNDATLDDLYNLAVRISPEFTSELFLAAAAYEIEQRNLERAKQFLQKATDSPQPFSSSWRTELGQNTVRIAALLKDSELMSGALRRSLLSVLSIGNPDREAVELSRLAVLARLAL